MATRNDSTTKMVRNARTRPAVAFLPWIHVERPLKIGTLRLIPYQRGAVPGDLPGVRQQDLDAILDTYADRPRKRVARATILEVGSWKSGDDVTGVIPKLFKARDFLCVSALSARRLFHGHIGYCNSHNYELVVQAFKPGDVTSVAFTTRRRDGASNVLWGANEFAFHRPLHVASDHVADFDPSLLRALRRLPASDSWIHEAIVEFNAANTDSPDVPGHVEAVMMKSAFDWLLQVDYKAKNFIKAVVRHLVPPGPVVHPVGPLTPQWLRRRPAGGVIEAWAEEFCNLRNMSAHGGSHGPKLVWSRDAHLVFATVLFPLLLKKIIAGRGSYRMTGADKLELSLLDQYLAYDPMKIRRSVMTQHPWHQILTNAQLRAALESALRNVKTP